MVFRRGQVVDYQSFEAYFSDKKLHFVVGDNDEFINQKHIDWHLEFAKSQNIEMDYTLFEGKHEILTPILETIFLKKIKQS